MSRYDLVYLGQKATQLGFVRDTLEKVYRLAEILEYINTEPLLRNSLALKGGTAINLTVFSLPRLSVDIDLDYLVTDTRAEMLAKSERITTKIGQFMAMRGYSKSPETAVRDRAGSESLLGKFFHADLALISCPAATSLLLNEVKGHSPQLGFRGLQKLRPTSQHRSSTIPGNSGLSCLAENMWLTQRILASLYDISIPAINQHIKKIFADR